MNTLEVPQEKLEKYPPRDNFCTDLFSKDIAETLEKYPSGEGLFSINFISRTVTRL